MCLSRRSPSSPLSSAEWSSFGSFGSVRHTRVSPSMCLSDPQRLLLTTPTLQSMRWTCAETTTPFWTAPRARATTARARFVRLRPDPVSSWSLADDSRVAVCIQEGLFSTQDGDGLPLARMDHCHCPPRPHHLHCRQEGESAEAP